MSGGPNTDAEGVVDRDLAMEWLQFSLVNCIGGRRIGKLLLSSTEIGKGSNGTVVFEGYYEGRAVAVKRLRHHDVTFDGIKNWTTSDRHPNIVRYHGLEFDQDFVYLALQRCAFNLDDLIQAFSDSTDNSVNDPASMVGYKYRSDSVRNVIQDVELWRVDGHPSVLLVNLMRDMISGLVHLHRLGLIHGNLKPRNVLITKNLITNNRLLYAHLSDMRISKCLLEDSSLGYHSSGFGSLGWRAPEQLLNGRQTHAMDVFSLGCVLFFCVSCGRHPFGKCRERDINIEHNKMDLSLVKFLPEAHDLFSCMLSRDLELRPKALEVLHHPFFWSPETRLSFLRDTSYRVQLEAKRAPNSDLLNEMESKGPMVFYGNWNDKMEPVLLGDTSKMRYNYSRLRDLLRFVHYKLDHYVKLSAKAKELIGPVPKGQNDYFTKRFPRLLMESYGVISQFCKQEEAFRKYFERGDYAYFSW